MPNYPLSQSQTRSGLDYGTAGNPFAPFGNYGPHYDLATQDIGHYINPEGQWYQTPNTASTRAAVNSYPAGGPRGAVRTAIDPLTGRTVNAETGQPIATGGFTAGAGSPTAAGVEIPYSGGVRINPNDPNQRYQAVNVVKSPEVATQTDALLKSVGAAADTIDFNALLKNYAGMMEGSRQKADTAFDITPYEQAMRTYQTTYGDTMGAMPGQYEDLNRKIAAGEQGIVTEARGLIPEYDAAINRAGDYASRQLSQNVLGRYSTGATAKAAGSGLARELLRGEAAIRVPLEQAKIQQKYNVLSQYAMPAELDMANRETARVTQFNPMVAAQLFQSGQNTEQNIMQAGAEMAKMSAAEANNYLQQLRGYMDAAYMPEERKIQILGALDQLYRNSRYQGLQDVLGTNVTPARSTAFVAPGYPAVPRYNQPTYNTGPDYGGAGTQTGTTPARTSAPSAYQAQLDKGWRFDSYNGVWRDANGQIMQQVNAQPNRDQQFANYDAYNYQEAGLTYA